MPSNRGNFREVQPDDGFPPASDELWKKEGGRVLNFLGEGKTWGDLTSWGKGEGLDQSMLRNCLAWLNINELAKFEIKSDRSVWKVVGH